MSLESLPRVCLVASVAPSPLPRGPTPAITHIHTQLPATCLLLAHLQSSLFQRLCTQTHTHSCLSFLWLTHTHTQLHTENGRTQTHTHGHNQMHPPCIFSNEYAHTCKAPLGTPLPTHLYTHTHTNGGRVEGTGRPPAQHTHPTERYPRLSPAEGGGRNVPSAR